jgi:ribosomal protein S18 acetylase RimI-like enzyme
MNTKLKGFSSLSLQRAEHPVTEITCLNPLKEISFRLLNVHDYGKFKNIRLAGLNQFPDHFGTTYAEELRSGPTKPAQTVYGAKRFHFTFGAFTEHQELIGICGFLAESRLKASHRGEIVQLYVDPEYKGLGIGKKLLRLSIEKAFNNEQIEQIILSVVFTNDHAIHLYRQLGFTEYGKLENYFKTGDKYFTQLFMVLSNKKKREYSIMDHFLYSMKKPVL